MLLESLIMLFNKTTYVLLFTKIFPMWNTILNKLPQIGLITQNLNSKGFKVKLIVILDIIESYERVYI